MLVRLGLSLVGFSVGVFFISWQMTENHLAHPRNPAWQIISTLRTLLLIFWIACGSIYAFLFLLDAIERRRARRKQIKLSQQEEELRKQERVANAKRWEIERRERKELEIKEQRALAMKQKQEAERREARIEKMKSRSPDEATNEALKDFC